MKSSRVIAPLAALVLLAGCGTPSAATAFVVDGKTVTQSTVDDVAEGCAVLAKQPAAAIRGQVAQYLLVGQVADAVSARLSKPISAAAEAAALKQIGGESLAADQACAPAARGLARYAAISALAGKEKLASTVGELDVKVNPAYGTWDPAKATFTGSGSLSREDLGQGKVFG